MENISKYCTYLDSTIQDVAACLDKTKIKNIYIIDRQNTLVGSVTDGDLRRGIINGAKLSGSIQTIMNPNPKFISEENRSQAPGILYQNNLHSIPVVNEKNKIVDFIFSTEFRQKPEILNPVVIMAGGFGTRLMPLTKDTPKPMLEVGGKPILEHILDRFISQGFKNFYISVHYKAEKIIGYFGDGSNKKISIQYLYEHEPLGTGGALSLIPKPLPTLPFIITNGDIISSVDYAALLEFHNNSNATATLSVRNLSLNVPFGVTTIKNYQLLALEEKPSFDFTINAGIYVLNSEVVNTVAQEKVHITEIFNDLLKAEQPVYCFPLLESWADIGHHEELKSVKDAF